MTGRSVSSKEPISQRQVWALCTKCIDTFNPGSHTVDSHAKELIEAYNEVPGNPPLDPDNADFIRQVFYGCTRYAPMLGACVSSYLNVKRRMNDCRTPLLVLLYLAMFRLDEVGVQGLKILAKGATSPSTVAEFFTFVFTLDSAQQHVLPLWKKVFDDEYVDGTLAAHITEHSPDLLALSEEFMGLQSGLESKKQAQFGGARVVGKQGTAPQPFQLSQTNRTARSVLPPDSSAGRQQRFRRPLEDRDIEEKVEAIYAYKSGHMASTVPSSVAKENRTKEAAIPFKAPQLHSLQRPQNTETVKRRVAEAEAVSGRVPTLSPSEVRRRMERSPAEVPRPTAAALLREEAVYVRKAQEEEAEAKKKVIELRDDSEFRAWQHKMQTADETAAKAAVAMRKVDMMLADEEARATRKREEQRRANIATKIKEELAEQVSGLKREQEQVLQDNRTFVHKQQELLDAGRTRALTQLRDERVSNARNVKEEDKLMELKAAQNIELEIQRKAELIKQIREEEYKKRTIFDETTGTATKRMFKRDFDPDSTMGFGTLHEMSLTELRGKLQETKSERESMTAIKRDTIERGREDGRRRNEQRLEEVLKRRATRHEVGVSQRRRKQEEERAAREQQEGKERVRLQALQAKLQEKREQRIADEEDRRMRERQRALDQELQAADGGAIERKRWIEKERGLQNIAKKKQMEGIQTIKTEGRTQSKLHDQRELWLDTQINATQRGRRQQQQDLKAASKQASDFRETEFASLRLAAATQHAKQTHNMKRHKQGIDAIADAVADLSLPAVTV